MHLNHLIKLRIKTKYAAIPFQKGEAVKQIDHVLPLEKRQQNTKMVFRLVKKNFIFADNINNNCY